MTTKVIQADRESLIIARQICADHDPGKAYQYLEGQRDDYMPMTAVLAVLASHADPLRRALEPFAKRCRETVRHDDDDNAGVTVRIKHLRAALAALSSGENNNGD